MRWEPHGEVPVVAIVGATATGKSDLALALAVALGGEVVNADASQLYAGMDVGTAKLSPGDRQGVPHHLLDVLDVRAEATVAAYQLEAVRLVDEIASAGAVPVVVGGSGLYVRAATDVLDIPPTDPAVRADWEQRLGDSGAGALHALLVRRDPVAAAAIGPANGRRLVRALEVTQLTGRPFSATMPTRTYRRPTVQIGLRGDRAVLNARIRTRVQGMWRSGMLQEVRELDARGLRQGRTASRAIGYAQALAQLDGVLEQDAAMTETARLTRRFARRQMSWFGADPRVQWLQHDDPLVVTRALDVVRAAGDRRQE